MSIGDQTKQFCADLVKSKNVCAVELNPTMRPEVAARLIKDVADHAARNYRSKNVVLVSFVK